VQAWRLRSLSIGFAGIVFVLVFVIAASLLDSQPIAQVVTELIALAIVPLLYVSFAPPAWLRREWRSAEEEGLRAFMEELLLSEDHRSRHRKNRSRGSDSRAGRLWNACRLSRSFHAGFRRR
jgi:hypothetical protein